MEGHFQICYPFGRFRSAETPLKRPMLTFLYLLYCVEAGIFLSLVPWSRVWVTSYFAQMPGLRDLLLNGYLRGGVSGIGLLHLVAACKDFLAFRQALKES